MHLEQNIKGICVKNGIDFEDFLSDMEVEEVHELSLFDLEAICEEYEIDMMALLFKPVFKSDFIQEKISKIKFLIIDVDGVMTDGGMYMTEKGDQMKKYNTKDGMALMHLTKSGFPVGIISSGFTEHLVQDRAKLLGIQHCYVGRESKINILNTWCADLNISLDEVGMIGDDINDLEIMKNIGFSTCPADAVNAVKSISHVILSSKGGAGCVREFIDTYLLKTPIS